MKQVLHAVDYLHNNGVCHRDLKPDNIMFNTKSKQIKVMDFNVSKRFKLTNEIIQKNKELFIQKDNLPSPNKFDIFGEDSTTFTVQGNL